MYAWIWRHLPFGLPGRIFGSLLLSVGAVALLWLVVFPWAEPLLPFDDVQVPQDPGGGAPGIDGGDPGLDGHDLPYDTTQNSSAPTPTGSR